MLQIKDISKEYRTGELVQKALDGVSLNLRDSEFVAILGPSGSGKTTLLNIIGGLDRYDSGDLVINGVTTEKYNDRDWDTYRNHSVGFVFQSYNLIMHQNVLSNVEMALTISGLSGKEKKERALKALDEVGLSEHVHKKPNQLSGGQMQRVALARALVNDPDILLADEPTGALDTETSIQVMDLMKQVARDRLVVMVTHNPELAGQYASRIVRLKDGKITDDTDPFEPGITEEAPPSGKRKASMSFAASLALSFSNLRTKIGRTILTSFAGSIGIIGIALILSLSTGVNDYINKIQKDTMASYPITITSTSFDLASVMMGPDAAVDEMAQEETQEEDGNKIRANYADIKATTAVATSIKENNLKDFKKYLDDPKSEIQQYIGENGIVYGYDVDFKVYSFDPAGKLVDTDIDTTKEVEDENNVLGNMMEARSLMLDNMSTMFGVGEQNARNFSEMMAGANGDTISSLIKDNYDLVYGTWPDEYDEVVIVINENDSLLSGRMYQLGLISEAQYRSAVRKIEAETEADRIEFNYKDICEHEFYLFTASDQYVKNSTGLFEYIGDDKDKMQEQLPNATKLKIAGIVKAAEDSDIQGIETTVAYTTKLTDYMIRHSDESEAVKAQEADPGTDVMTGQPFETEEPDEATKAVKGRQYIEGLNDADKAAMFSSLMMLDYEGGMQAFLTTQMGIVGDQLSGALSQAIGQAINSAISSAMTQVGAQIENAVSQIQGGGQIPYVIPTIPETGGKETETESSQDSPSEEEETQTGGSGGEEETTAAPDASCIPDNIDWAEIERQINSMNMEQILYNYSFGDNLNIDLDLGSAMNGISLEMGEADMKDVVNYWLANIADAKALAKVYDQFIGVSDYEQNMDKFGKVSYDSPSSINLYADTFEGKDGIAASIKNYNESRDKENRITYTDYVALITSSITTIINAISYVLIGFVAVSLFVSCIMIGIITNISVLERTKEIGVLRALGASKRNISNVFNAETFIIGCFSGILGIGVSLLLILPINAIVHGLMGSTVLSAKLPPLSALILIIISIGITMIGGLIPAGKAAKKDPVIALRTE